MMKTRNAARTSTERQGCLSEAAYRLGSYIPCPNKLPASRSLLLDENTMRKQSFAPKDNGSAIRREKNGSSNRRASPGAIG